MLLKMLMVGESGTGKTHLCCKIAKVTRSVLFDVDVKAESIIQKIDKEGNIRRIPVEESGNTSAFVNFLNLLKPVLKSDDVDLVIIDSLTELKELIKRHIKNKIVTKGEFWVGGVERTEAKKIDPDLFVLTWELHPPVYDRIRDIMEAINTSGKSFIVTYHPPHEKASSGEIKMLQELKRKCNMVVTTDGNSVSLKNDTFLNPRGEMGIEQFVTYVRSVLKAKSMDEVSLY